MFTKKRYLKVSVLENKGTMIVLREREPIVMISTPILLFVKDILVKTNISPSDGGFLVI